MGWRGRGRSRLWPGAGPFSHLPPWQRPGWVYGYSSRGAFYDPSICQRFPWLPRGWWANPYTRSYWVQQPLVYGYGYPYIYPKEPTPDAELEMLESYLTQLEDARETVNKRIEELKKMIEEGAKKGTTQITGLIPFWGLHPYGALTPEQERMIREQQAKALEDQIDAIKKRLEELKR